FTSSTPGFLRYLGEAARRRLESPPSSDVHTRNRRLEMRTFAAVAALLMMLVSVGSAQQGGFTTPTDGPESAKLAATYDPTRDTYITDADIEAAIRRLRPDGVSANGVFVERHDAASISGLAYRLQID